MSLESAIALVDSLVFSTTGKHLSNLQVSVLQAVWHGKKYLAIAQEYGYTEGHIKDIAYHLWKLLSERLNEKVTKNNLKSVVSRLSSAENILTCNPNFIGRETAIEHLDNLVNQGHKIIVIQGEGGIGKTTLAQHYLNQQASEFILELLMAKTTQNITLAESIVEEWLKKDFQEEPAREFGITLARLKRHLETHKVGILIDNLEPALDREGKFIASQQNYIELLRILADPKVQSTTLITSRDRLCEPDINPVHFRLPGLSIESWTAYFKNSQIDANLSIIESLHKIYGGNAKAMKIIGGVIQEDFAGDSQAYWQIYQKDPLLETNLKHLVASQFDRLQTLDHEAYKLLCRLGSYRYQDISYLNQASVVNLLWDSEPNIGQLRSVQSLQNRSLLECKRGHYWLHPVIQAEAIFRLKEQGEWEITNRRIAEFWTNSIAKVTTVTDALMALEAYYHYLEIGSFSAAGKVILKSYDNQWGQFLSLGSILYRMGLIQPILSAINQIIDKIDCQSDCAELYNILGDVYWILGKINLAIDCQTQTIQVARKCWHDYTFVNKHTQYYLKMLEVDSRLSIGLYNIDLWELLAACDRLQTVIELTENTQHYRWGQKATICLALIQSYLGEKDKALSLAERCYQELINNPLAGRFAYFLQILGQTYVNLNQFDRATSLFEKTLAFSQENNYSQVKGKVLTGQAEIYQKKQSFELALSHHFAAIEVLENIGAKCDLAQAYYQLGLTLKLMGEYGKSATHLEKAIVLFTEMQAPKQVDKVLIVSTQ